MSRIHPASGVRVDRAVVADALVRGVPKEEDDDEEEHEEDEESDGDDEDQGDGYSE